MIKRNWADFFSDIKTQLAKVANYLERDIIGSEKGIRILFIRRNLKKSSLYAQAYPI